MPRMLIVYDNFPPSQRPAIYRDKRQNPRKGRYGTDLTFISWNLLNQAPFVHHDGPSPPELNSIQTFSTLKCIQNNLWQSFHSKKCGGKQLSGMFLADLPRIKLDMESVNFGQWKKILMETKGINHVTRQKVKKWQIGEDQVKITFFRIFSLSRFFPHAHLLTKKSLFFSAQSVHQEGNAYIILRRT